MPADTHTLIITPTNPDHPAPPVYAQGAYLLDADTGATLYAHNPFLHLPIMSTTKLMTALLAAENGTPNEIVSINDQVAHDISQLPPDSANINRKRARTYTLQQMLYGLLSLGQRCRRGYRDTIGGTYSHFIAMMNQKATNRDV